MSLKPVLDALDDIGRHSKVKEKTVLVEKYCQELGSDFINTALYAYDPFRKFKTTQVSYVPTDSESSVLEIFKMLDYLSQRKGCNNIEAAKLSSLASIDEETVEICNRIVNKDLRCGCSISTFKKFVKGLVEYKAMSAKGSKHIRMDWDRFRKAAKSLNNIGWSVKMDGVRVSYAIVHIDDTVEYLSRSGHIWRNFSIFDNELVTIAEYLHTTYEIPYPMKFDGEVITTDVDFQRVMGEVRRYKDIDIESLRFIIWDVICDEKLLPYNQTYTTLTSVYSNIQLLPLTQGSHESFTSLLPDYNQKVFLLEYHMGLNWTRFEDMSSKCREIIEDGDEGIVVKINNHIHEYKKSVSWLKCKSLYLEGLGIEADLEVHAWEPGGGKYTKEGQIKMVEAMMTRYGTASKKDKSNIEEFLKLRFQVNSMNDVLDRISKDDWHDSITAIMGKLVCSYNGVEVKVGGGYSDIQRIQFMTETPRMIEVHADSETNDGNLRMPQFKRVRDDK